MTVPLYTKSPNQNRETFGRENKTCQGCFHSWLKLVFLKLAIYSCFLGNPKKNTPSTIDQSSTTYVISSTKNNKNYKAQVCQILSFINKI